MLKRIDYKSRECLARTSCPKRQPKPVLLTKGQSTYNKLQKEMNEAPKDYNAIKSLIETNENSIEKTVIIFKLKILSQYPTKRNKQNIQIKYLNLNIQWII